VKLHRLGVETLLISMVVVGCGGGSAKSHDGGPDGPPLPQCSDGIDNDGDGKIDYPNDPGCFVAQQDIETDDCPDGPGCPQCGNGKDDDNNGLTDYPADPGCTSAGDSDEYTDNPIACGAGIAIHPLPASGMVMGTLDAQTKFSKVSPCGGGDTTGIVAAVYELRVYAPKVIVASAFGSPADTVIDVRSAMCDSAMSERACSADVATPATVALQPGTYYVLVESKTNMAAPFMLAIQQLAGEGTACTDVSDCGPGLVCRIPHGGTTMSCEMPVCNDGIDDDGDGKLDFPDDPGCTSATDADETDDCPSGPNCPACGNGRDDDGDGQIDYPNDTSCTSASGASEASCPNDMDNYGAVNAPSMPGDLTSAHKDITFTCQSNTGNDASFVLVLPTAVSTLTVSTEGSTISDTVLEFWQGACTTQVACDDDSGTGNLSSITQTNVAAGTYAISVGAYSTGNNGPFTLNVHGTLAAGKSCETALFAAGVLTCDTSLSCKGTAGSRTCQPAQCSDGSDNDGDGKTDYPADPGCTGPGDDDETDDCPSGPNCPVCSNGIDDDGDMKTDYPADPSCTSASGTSEASCPNDMENFGSITAPTMTGDLTTGHSDLTFTCSLTPSGNDASFLLDLPVPVLSLTADTEGSTITDTQVEVWSGACATALACDDDGGTGLLSSATVTNLAAGHYAISVAAYSTSSNGPFHLNVHGTLAAGTRCDSALVTAGVLACDSGLTCGGVPATCN
jgi:hypothetical protein